MKKCIVVVLLGFLLMGCGKTEDEKEEVVWYVSDSCFEDPIMDEDLYKPIENEKTKAVNAYLEKQDEDFEIVFKAYRDEGEGVKTIKEKDKEADIAPFDYYGYNEFEELDFMLSSEEGKKLNKEFSKEFWESQKVNHKTLQIPKPGFCGYGTSFFVDKEFMENNHLTAEDFSEQGIAALEKITEIAQKDPSYKKEYCVTLSGGMNVSYLLRESYTSLMKDEGLFEGIVIRSSDGKVVNSFEEPEFQKQMAMYQKIWKEDLDAHVEEMDLPQICFLGPSYSGYIEGMENGYEEIPISGFSATKTVGYGILKESEQKETALKALTAVYTEPELSNILIHGIEGEDYEVEDGYAVYKEEKGTSSPYGTYIGIGNNLLAYPTQVEDKNKKEIVERSWMGTAMKPENGFVPDISEFEEEYDRITEIYMDAQTKLSYEDVGDIQAFYTDVNQKLKNAGIENVIVELQKQLDAFMEETDGTEN